MEHGLKQMKTTAKKYEIWQYYNEHESQRRHLFILIERIRNKYYNKYEWHALRLTPSAFSNILEIGSIILHDIEFVNEQKYWSKVC